MIIYTSYVSGLTFLLYLFWGCKKYSNHMDSWIDTPNPVSVRVEIPFSSSEVKHLLTCADGCIVHVHIRLALLLEGIECV